MPSIVMSGSPALTTTTMFLNYCVFAITTPAIGAVCIPIPTSKSGGHKPHGYGYN